MKMCDVNDDMTPFLKSFSRTCIISFFPFDLDFSFVC